MRDARQHIKPDAVTIGGNAADPSRHAGAVGEGGTASGPAGRAALRATTGPANGATSGSGTSAASDAGLIVGADGRARPRWAATDPLLREYYDTEWGMPVRDEHGLFERLSLEAFQSGLSWVTVLRKRPAFRAAFADFDPEVVAEFGEVDVERLLADASIIRNRMKIEATLQNARATLALRGEGGLAELIWSFQPSDTPKPARMSEVPSTSPESIALAKTLRAKGFRFVGPVTAFALMEAVGIVDTHLLGSHRRGSSGVWTAEGSQDTGRLAVTEC